VSARDLVPPEARVLPFRRRSGAVRVRRRNPWLALGRPFVQALGLVGAPAAIAAWLLTAPAFALAHVEVAGHRYVDPAWVESSLAGLTGQNLIRLPLDQAGAQLARHPWVAAVRLEKRLPDRLRVVLEERRPAALLRSGARLVYLDGAGTPIAPLDPQRGPADLLLVSVGARGDVDLAGAIEVARELAAAVPEWAAGLSEVEALGGDDFRLFLDALPFPLTVRRGTLAARLPALAALLPELERRYARLAGADLRSDRRIVLQPVAERSS
jgi:cell division septal protein FtsQ